ncbi:MAG: hypothetical protein QY322_00595 [bacterium]|nr:MAG: hypothetical protein QY322_00595 [bacterium]
MILNSNTLLDIVIEENSLLLKSQQKYGDLYKHVNDVYMLVSNFFDGYLGNFDQGTDLLLRFHTEMRNFYLLSMFSIVRLHSVQASLNLRLFMEASCNLGYSIANPNYKDFAATDEFGILDPSNDLKSKRYKWLDDNYSDRSIDLKKIKKQIQFNSHSNLVNTFKNTKHIFDKNNPPETQTLFFDIEDEYLVKAALWQLSNTCLACLNLIYEVNRDFKKLVLINDYENQHARLMATNLKFRDSFMTTDRFQKADSQAKKKENKNTA